MLFEIYSPEGHRVEWAEHPQCVPSKEQYATKAESGYKFKLNGKDIKSYREIETALNSDVVYSKQPTRKK